MIRLPGGVLVGLTADEVRALVFVATPAAVRDRYARAGLTPAGALALVGELRAALTSDRPVSATDPLPSQGEEGASGDPDSDRFISTAKAAGLLGITPRGVVYLRRQGHLVGRQRVTRGTWEISEQSVRAYMVERDLRTERRTA